jgi:hypothetical protein
MKYTSGSIWPYRIVLAGELAAKVLAYAGSVLFLVSMPSVLQPAAFRARVSAWLSPISQAEQAIFDRIFPSLAGFPVQAFFFIGVLLSVAMFGSWTRLRRARINAEARMDDRAAVLLLRSFRDTAFQEEQGQMYPLLAALSVAVLPFPLMSIALSAGEERILITEIDRLLGDKVRVLMLSPRGVKSAFGLYSDHLEIRVKDRLWEKAFLLLAQSCRAILLVPSATSGLLREVELLRSRSDLLQRTVVILPPRERQQHGWWRFTSYRHDPAKSWLAVRQAWNSLSLRLPAYPDRGIAFLPEQDFSVRKGVSLNGSIGTLGAAVAHLLPSKSGEVPASLAIAGIDALTGRRYQRFLWFTAILVSVLTIAILTASVGFGWTSWKDRRTREKAMFDTVTRVVTEGERDLFTGKKYRLDPQLSVALALYAWDHSGKKRLAVAKALLAATRDSIFDADPEFSVDFDPVFRVAPQNTGSLMVESDLSLRKFTVTPALKEIGRISRDKLCVNGKVGMGAASSLAIACNATRTITVAFDGKQRKLPETDQVQDIAIEGKRMIWADSRKQVVFEEEGRVVWRTAIRESVSQVLMSPDGRYAWIQGAATGFLIDLDRRTRVFSHPVHGNNGAGFSPSGRYFIEGRWLHDLTAQTSREIGWNEHDAVTAVTSDGSLIAVGLSSGVLEVIDGTGTWPIAKVDGAFRSLAFIGDTRRLAGGAGNQVLVFDIDAAFRLRPLIKLLESSVAANRAILPDSEVRDIDEQLRLVRSRARKLEPEECEAYLKMDRCPAGV